MANSFHHLHKRERIHKKHEKYPHSNKWKNLLDKVIYFIAIVGPLISIPQVLKIWSEQTAEGLSLFTWSGYLFGGFFWLAYGIMHKEKPIILTNCLWIIINIGIISGILIYGDYF